MIPCIGALLLLLISAHFHCTRTPVCVITSRQRYVLGDSAMHKMARATVFISGMTGLGVEIGNTYCMHIHTMYMYVVQYYACMYNVCVYYLLQQRISYWLVSR